MDKKSEADQRALLWTKAERALTQVFDPEVSRTSGLLAVKTRRWSSALLRLSEAVAGGVNDLQTLDALGEAAYQAQSPEALLPFQGLYQHPMVATHMGRALMMMGDFAGAEKFLSLAQESILKSAIQALLGFKGSIQQAIESMVGTMDRYPEMRNLHYPEFWQALAVTASTAGREDLVRLAEQRTKAQAYAKPEIHFNQAQRLLAKGELRAGWRLYESRLVPGSVLSIPTALGELAMWEGQSLKGRTLLVVPDNGLGDQLFGLRFIQPLLNEGARIELMAGPELRPLLAASFPGMVVHPAGEAQREEYWKNRNKPDYWIYSLSIPARAHLFEFVNTARYLTAPEDLCEIYQGVLREKNSRNLPVFGMVWHGDIRTAFMRTRAYTVQEFLEASGVLKQPCFLVSLQKDATPAELHELEKEAEKAGCQWLNAAPTLKDFAHTAAWIRNLDRLYSCDTACAHAGGALGAPTTALIRNQSIWHWIARPEGQAFWYDSVSVKYALNPEFSYLFDIREV
jgi:hypothetical protein